MIIKIAFLIATLFGLAVYSENGNTAQPAAGQQPAVTSAGGPGQCGAGQLCGN